MHAAATSCRTRSGRTWIATIDGMVLSSYDNGFLHSFIFHVVLLLVLALTTLEPRQPAGAVRLALAFDAGDEPVALLALADPVELPPELVPALEVAADLIAADAWNDRPPELQPALDVLDAAAGAEMAGLDAGEMLAEVVAPTRLQGSAAGSRSSAGRGLGDGAGFAGELGRRLKAAGAHTGDVQISIAWDNFNDVDLHVMVDAVAPWRGTSLINYGNPRGACGGWLDVDQNVFPTTPAAVENVFWALGTAPYGRYTIYVQQFRNWGGSDPTKVHVAVLVDGNESHHTVFVHAGRRPVRVTEFVRRVRATAKTAPAGLVGPGIPPTGF